MKGYQTHTQTGILLNANEASQNVDDNVKQEILDAIGKVREIYPNVMLLDFENKRSQNDLELELLTNKDLQEKTPEQLFADFYLKQNNQELTNQQQKILQQVLAEALQETER